MKRYSHMQMIDTFDPDAKSLSYEKMDAETFERWYNSVINVAVKEYGQEVNTLNNIMEFA